MKKKTLVILMLLCVIVVLIPSISHASIAPMPTKQYDSLWKEIKDIFGW